MTVTSAPVADVADRAHAEVAGGRGLSTRAAHLRAVRRVARWVVGGLMVLAALCLACVGVGVATGTWQIRPVLSGSMRPDLPIGGVVVTERVPMRSLAVGDVAVFHPPAEPHVDYVHRIIWMHRTGSDLLVRTKGDANVTPDPWTLHLRGKWAYVARWSLPWVGYAAVWLHQPSVRRAAVIGAGLLAAVLVGSVLVEQRRKGHPSADGDTPPRPGSAPAATS